MNSIRAHVDRGCTLLNNIYLLEGPVQEPFSTAFTICRTQSPSLHFVQTSVSLDAREKFLEPHSKLGPNSNSGIWEASAYDDVRFWNPAPMYFCRGSGTHPRRKRRLHQTAPVRLVCSRCHGDVTLIADYDVRSQYDPVQSTRRNAARSRQFCRTSPPSVERIIALGELPCFPYVKSPTRTAPAVTP
jgi:hypothetical protein